MITLTHATVRFGATTALDDFTGAFPEGTVTAVVGGDGAGKSTLLRVLAGLVPATSHQDGLIGDRHRIGYQPADSGVWRNLSVAENVGFVARTYRLDRATTRTRATQLLERAGLETARDRVAAHLSGGMRQKLGFVLATLHRPDLVLLDEPTTGVDPLSRADLWTLIASAAAEGTTVVMATTYLDEAERAGRLYLLRSGRVIASGTPDEVIAATPGAVWQAPADGRAPLTGWRRGRSIRVWTRDAGPAPEGFARVTPDLEDAAIVAQLGAGEPGAADAPVEEPEAEPSPRHAADGAPLLIARDVVRHFGSVTALDGVSLVVGPGEVVGLIGGNGAGKTTLIRLALGLERPDAGSCLLLGGPPTLRTRRRIGYVAQGLALYPSLTARENLDFASSVHGVRPGEQALEFTDRLGRRKVGTLPLGIRRQVAYLAACVHDPDLLVLDEPTSGMDPLGRSRLWSDLRATAESGTGVLVTTHYMAEAAQCDRVVLLAAGRVIASGSPADLTGAHRSVVVRTARWAVAFSALRAAGLPATLAGRDVRVAGHQPDEVRRELPAGLGEVRVEEAPATLDEVMVLAAR